MENVNQKINVLAIGFLECMGNVEPTQEEIDLTETLLATYVLDEDGDGLRLKTSFLKKES